MSEAPSPVRVRELGRKGISVKTYSLNGGYSYGGTIDVAAATIADAAGMWFDRWSSNGLRKVEGVYWPCFGDMDDDDYAVIDYVNEEVMTRKAVLDMFQEWLTGA